MGEASTNLVIIYTISLWITPLSGAAASETVDGTGKIKLPINTTTVADDNQPQFFHVTFAMDRVWDSRIHTRSRWLTRPISCNTRITVKLPT